MCFDPIMHCITSTSAPEFGYKQPWITGLGNFILIPTNQAIGLYNAVDSDTSCCTKLAYKVLSVFLNLLLLPITLLGMLLKGIGAILPNHKYEEHELTDVALKVPGMHPQDSSEIYRLLDAFNTVCKEQQIPFFLEGGSSLGAERHQGIIPWDNDADVGLAAEHLPTLLAAQDAFKAAGLTFTCYMDGLYQLAFKDSTPISTSLFTTGSPLIAAKSAGPTPMFPSGPLCLALTSSKPILPTPRIPKPRIALSAPSTQPQVNR